MTPQNENCCYRNVTFDLVMILTENLEYKDIKYYADKSLAFFKMT